MPPRSPFALEAANILFHLNYRWTLQALALWKGIPPPFKAYEIYEGFEKFLSPKTLALMDRLEPGTAKTRLRHGVMDHYLQNILLPHETEMRTWMRGAAAHVNGRKLYFKDIIPWCQTESTYETRQILQKEVGPLCKFLRPFALNFWRILLGHLKKDLHFEGYADYCSQKKGLDYGAFYPRIKELLERTDGLYFGAMEAWSRERFGRPLHALTRFDAIHLLSLREFDARFSLAGVASYLNFFRVWDMDPREIPGLSLEIGREEGKSAQAMCFILQVPEEVTISMMPQGGWMDLETLWHELGHGLSAALTSPGLPLIEKDLSTSFCLSEGFAFLLQNLTMSQPFLQEVLGLAREDAVRVSRYKVLRDLSLFRRYGAKFLAEYEMFEGGDLSNGEIYARTLLRYTGFSYQPEGHLFDLVPEFYCLDYVLAWMAEAVFEAWLKRQVGGDWTVAPATGEILRTWWSSGNSLDIFSFLERHDLGPLDPTPLLGRWEACLG